MKKLLVAAAAATALLLAGCSTGAAESPSSAPAAASAGAATTAAVDAALSGGGGVPPVVQPVEVRQLVHDTLKGKNIAFVPILYKGFKITEEWGKQMESVFGNLGANFQVYDSNFDTDQMVKTINDLIANKKADVLILHNPDLNVLTQQIKDAQAAGIYVVVLNMISNQSGDAFIGADLVSAAQDITTRAAADCKAAGKTKIALINGPSTDPWNVLYQTGVKNVADAQGLEIVDVTDSKWQADLANQQAATLLQQHGKDLCALMLPWDVIAIPASQAVKKAEQAGTIAPGSVGVYSIDSSIDGCNAIKNGDIRASVAYDQTAIGAGAALATQQLLELGNKPGSQRTVSFVPHTLIDKNNLDKVTYACYTGKS